MDYNWNGIERSFPENTRSVRCAFKLIDDKSYSELTALSITTL